MSTPLRPPVRKSQILHGKTSLLKWLALWGALVLCRLRLSAPWHEVLSRERLDSSYLLAVTVMGALFFNQVIGYELILLVLLAPLLLHHHDNGQHMDALFLLGLLFCLMIPIGITGEIANRLNLQQPSLGRTMLPDSVLGLTSPGQNVPFGRRLFLSHRCFGMAVLALYLLMRGPTRKIPASAAPEPPVDRE